jgi:serine/threonine-protein kinase
MVGRTVLHYQFLEKLGAGGMGDIYKARDTRLNRFVAIKVLAGDSAAEPERRRRFIQEAQAASGLNHPHIIVIHDIISEGETEFMVMEYVTGKTLADLIPKGGLRVPQALKYAVQMTGALSTAHAAGIVHRDLKPGNVMITDSGLVKILDFGLAKLTDRGPMSQVGDATQTIADAPLTVEGSIVGTVSYMSPEQAQGKKVDSRSDIFSLGVVLYEMLTGSRAFGGDSALSTLSAILRDEARPIAEIAPDVPPQLEQVITRCLRKNPDHRWQTMNDVQMALNALKHESDSGMLYKDRIRADKKSSPVAVIGIAAGLIIALAGAGSWWWTTHRKLAPPTVELRVTPPPAPIVPGTPAPVPSDSTLTNESILEMLQAKVPTGVILSHIRSSRTNFNLSTDEIIRLAKAGVPETVIEQMHHPRRALAAPITAASAPEQHPAPITKPPAPLPSPEPVSAGQTVSITIPDGSPFRIALADDIPADAAEGQALRFVAVDDFRIKNAVVIANGAPVTGTIAETGKKKFLGMGGSKLTFRLMQVNAVDGRKLNVRATPARRPDGSAHRPVEGGSRAKLKEIAAGAGTEYLAYTDGEQTVSAHK